MFAARCEVGGARFEKTRIDGADIAEVGFWVVRVQRAMNVLPDQCH
jgi:hypothetical protein